jgi:hypothetical protein
VENIVFLGRPFGAPLAPPLLYASTTLPMQGLSASAGNANGIAPTLLYYFRYTSAALPSRLSGDRFDRAYLGSQRLCGELSPPVIERLYPPSSHVPPDLAAVGTDLPVSAAGLIRNKPHRTAD